MHDSNTRRLTTLNELISEYSNLRTISKGREQQRGRRFNGLIGDVLTCWGIDAETGFRGHRGYDEIDVGFTVGDLRFIMEAKWQAKPLPDGARARLVGLIASRLDGTRGVILSMSGYTGPALAKAAQSGQPRILLLDHAHFESLICGLRHPRELLDTMLTRASYQGGAYVSLTDLLIERRPAPPPTLSAGVEASLPWDVVAGTAQGVTATVALIGDDDWETPSGIAAGRAGRLLITVPSGIIEVDIATGATGWSLPLRGCHGSPAVQSHGGGIFVQCHRAVVRWSEGALAVVDGGFSPSARLFAGHDDDLWVLDHVLTRDGIIPTLIRLGRSPGDKHGTRIDFPVNVRDAASLADGRFFLAAGGHSVVVDLAGSGRIDRKDWIPSREPSGLLALADTTVIAASVDGSGVDATVLATDIATRTTIPLCHLKLNAVYGLASAGNGRAYLLGDIRGNDPAPRPVILVLTGLQHD